MSSIKIGSISNSNFAIGKNNEVKGNIIRSSELINQADILAIQEELECAVKQLKEGTQIYNALNDNGVLLFSQMHPLISATPAYQGYFLGDFFAFSSYQQEGRRDGKWFNEHVVSYHRRLSSIISTLSRSGFFVENVVEPIPSEEALMEFSKLQRDLVRPTFLIVKARKITSFSCS